MSPTTVDKILLMRPTCRVEKRGYLDINPLPPLGMGYLSAVLRRAGHDVEVYDSLMEHWGKERDQDERYLLIGPDAEELRGLLRASRPRLVGLTIMFSNQADLALEAARVIKDFDPSIVIVAGGAHPSILPLETLENPYIDYVVVGEGEQAMLDILDRCNGRAPLGGLRGVGFKNAAGECVLADQRGFNRDLDSLPFPDWEAIKVERYFGLSASHGMRTKPRFMPIITSRGCPGACTFCSAHRVWGKAFRKRSVEHVLAEMRLLKERYGIQELLIEDDNITLDPKRAKRLFTAMIEEGFDFVIDTPNGVAAWTLDDELVELMSRVGFRRINLALESGSQRVLDEVIRKPIQLERMPALIQCIRSHGMDANAFFVVGLPGETLDDIAQTFRFIVENRIEQAHLSLATPYPGTQLYETCKEQGLFTRPYELRDLYLWSYMIQTPDWTVPQLKEAIDRGYAEVAKMLAQVESERKQARQ